MVVNVNIVPTGPHTKNLIKNLEKMYKLDLHGYKIDKTTEVVDSFIYEHLIFGSKQLEIITGDSRVVRGVVQEVVENYGLECKPHVYNPNVLTIDL